MTNWERFQQLNGATKMKGQQVVNSHFLYKGYPSIEITDTQGSAVQAAVVNKQESDEAYIYTQLQNPLQIGSIWAAKNLHLLVTEEITIIHDVDWHKYHCFLCNLEVDGLWGWFVGPEKTHINLNLKKETVLVSQQKPLLVLPGMPLAFQDKIMIKGRAWIVDEYDAISDEGITYYSLMPTTMSKEVIADHASDPVFVEEYKEPVFVLASDSSSTSAVEIAPGSTHTVTTENGYFKTSNTSIKVLQRNHTQVSFQVPYGVSEFTIETKNNNASVTTTYKVVY